jgi:hypothetical protein
MGHTLSFIDMMVKEVKSVELKVYGMAEAQENLARLKAELHGEMILNYLENSDLPLASKRELLQRVIHYFNPS